MVRSISILDLPLSFIKHLTEQVERVTRAAPTAPASRKKVAQKEEEEESEEEISVPQQEDKMKEDEEDEEEVAKPKKQRAKKKAIPVGKNGLKKKRVVKSRQTTDAKGYTGRCLMIQHPPHTELISSNSF
jgi:DNA polymerase delta subunit 3